MKKLLFCIIGLSLVLILCGCNLFGNNQKKPKNPPLTEISQDGYWMVKGFKTDYKVCTCDEKDLSDTDEHIIRSDCSAHTVIRQCNLCSNFSIIDMLPIVAHSFTDRQCTVCGAYEPSEDITYELNSDGSGYTAKKIHSCPDKFLVIPDIYEGLPVTAIGEYFFRSLPDYLPVEKAVIGKNVKTIENYAFSHVRALQSVSLPEGLTTIGDGAFSGCAALVEISLPSSVTSIGQDAFAFCGSLASVNIPDGIKRIESYTFTSCKSLTQIKIPESVTVICMNAFSSSGLKSVKISKNVISIEKSAFMYCQNLEYISVANDNPCYKSIDGHLYTKDGSILITYACQNTATSFTLPAEVTVISANAFTYAIHLKSITLHDSVTAIGVGAFSECMDLESITLPSGITVIEPATFADCHKLANIHIPESVTDIGDKAFSGCYALTYIEIPKGVTSLGEYAFSRCESLKSLELPSGVTLIKSSLLQGCISLEQITFHGQITAIADNAFTSCRSLESITIPDSVIRINRFAFYNCSALKSVTIGIGVKIIDEKAFHKCDALTDVYYNGTHEQWSRIRIYYGNNLLTDATLHCND